MVLPHNKSLDLACLCGFKSPPALLCPPRSISSLWFTEQGLLSSAVMCLGPWPMCMILRWFPMGSLVRCTVVHKSFLVSQDWVHLYLLKTVLSRQWLGSCDPVLPSVSHFGDCPDELRWGNKCFPFHVLALNMQWQRQT